MYSIHTSILSMNCTPCSRAGQRPVCVLRRPAPTCGYQCKGIQSPARLVRCTTSARETGPGANKESSSKEAMEVATAALIGLAMVSPAIMAGAIMATVIKAAEAAKEAVEADKERVEGDLVALHFWGVVTVTVCLLGKVTSTEQLGMVPALQLTKAINTAMWETPLSTLARIVGREWRTVAWFCLLLAAVLLAARGL